MLLEALIARYQTGDKIILECSLTYVTDYHVLNCRTIGVEWSGLVSRGQTLFSRGDVYRFSNISASLSTYKVLLVTCASKYGVLMIDEARDKTAL